MKKELLFMTTLAAMFAGCTGDPTNSGSPVPDFKDPEEEPEEPTVTVRPNIVVIVTDDENKSSVGCYESLVNTPNIDKLAANGIKFTNANVVATVSSPSRYSLLTGRYYSNCSHEGYVADNPEGEVSCIGNDCYLETDGDNLPSRLQAAGYTTGFVGKYHLARHDLLVNNKSWAAAGLKVYDSAADPRTDETVNEAMHYNHDWWAELIRSNGFDYANGVYSANTRELFNAACNVHNVEWSADCAVDFIEKQKGSDKPFFLYMATTYTHGPAPYLKPNGELKYSLDADPCLTGAGVVEEMSYAEASRQAIDKAESVATRAAAQWWDNEVGKITNKLVDMGIADNTIVIYISDHGNYKGSKSTLYDEGTCVPMIIQWPQGITQRGTYSHVVGSIDIAPTIYDVAGVLSESSNVDGVSLKPIFSSLNNVAREALMLEMGYARAVKTDKYKYIAIRYPENPKTKISPTTGKYYIMQHAELAEKAASYRDNYFDVDQLYDFNADPAETKNLYGVNPALDEEYKELLKQVSAESSNRPFGEFYPAN